jgi:chromosome segregation ATPase
MNKYDKKIVEAYIADITKDKMSAEIALEIFQEEEKDLEKRSEKQEKEVKTIKENLDELNAKKKEGIKDKELRDQNKELIQVVSEKFETAQNEIVSIISRLQQVTQKISQYEDFIETMEKTIEKAKSRVSK